MTEPGSNTALVLEDQTLRDGLQMESRIIGLAQKRQLVQMLQQAGVGRIQVGSFVHPETVPQLADTDALIQSLGPQKQSSVSALILNAKGLQRALDCSLGRVSMSVSVSDTHSRKNVRRPAAEALANMAALIDRALAEGLDVQAGLQCVFGCVYEGTISQDAVLRSAERLVRTGVKEISLADTTGMASPSMVQQMVQRIGSEFDGIQISLHLHDTRGLGLANAYSGYEAGVRSFDTCTGGLGGCPFVKGAAGNLPTEDVVNMFESMGVATGIDLMSICKIVEYLEKLFGRRLPGKMKQVLYQGGGSK